MRELESETSKLTTWITFYSMLSALLFPEPVLAHGEGIVYTVGAIFLAYQLSLALVLVNAQRLVHGRIIALGVYALAIGILWRAVILTDLEIFSLSYLLLSFGIPLVVTIGVYMWFRNGD